MPSKPLVVPVKQLARCRYCQELTGEWHWHPMLPKASEPPRADHCTCELVDAYEPRVSSGD